MRRCGLVLLFAVALTASSCGPYLKRFPSGSEQAYETSARCSQGPLVLQVRATGARWGEYVTFRVVSPRALVGRYRIFVDGKPDLHGAWRTAHSVPAENNSTRDVADTAPANAACVERPAERIAESAMASVEVAAPPAAVSAAEPEWAPLPDTAQAVVGVDALATGALTGTVEVGGSSEVTLVPTQEKRAGAHHTTIVSLTRRTEDREAPPPFAEGALIRIELWSEAPNDFAGARFEAERGVFAPSGSEAEWFAELDKREADEIRERHHRNFDLRKENEQRRREADAKRQRCREDATRSECAPPPVRVRAAPRPQPAPTAAAVPEVVVPQPRPPTEPPPPPKQSLPTATVSYATWVAGFWEWTGFEWVWLDGWWKVDEQRRVAAARQATVACPAPRVEAAPPQPMVGATWHGGVWAWAGVAWQWLPGAWRVTARSSPVHPAVPVTPQPAPR